MTVSFNVFGIEVATLRVDLPEPEQKQRVYTPVEKGVKAMSWHWVRQMLK